MWKTSYLNDLIIHSGSICFIATLVLFFSVLPTVDSFYITGPRSIRCFGPVPEGNYEISRALPNWVFGDHLTARDFDSMTQLCAEDSNGPASFGFQCNPIVRRVQKGARPSHPLKSNPTVEEACLNNCVCLSSWTDFIGISSAHGQFGQLLSSYFDEHGLTQQSICGDGSPEACTELIHDLPGVLKGTDWEMDSRKVCKIQCSKANNFKCAGEGAGCVCTARRVNADVFGEVGCGPVDFGGLYQAAGGIDFQTLEDDSRGGRLRFGGSQSGGRPRLGGKRDLSEYACPCNVSYVSASCCNAKDGLVWEAPELKLGVLMDL